MTWTDDLEARHAAITPGLWGYSNNQGEPPDGGWNVWAPGGPDGTVTVARHLTREDAAFVCHAQQDVGRLLAELRALRLFAILTIEEADNAARWYHARASGGQNVGVARMPPGVAQRILRDAQSLGLSLVYSDTTGTPAVAHRPGA